MSKKSKQTKYNQAINELEESFRSTYFRSGLDHAKLREVRAQILAASETVTDPVLKEQFKYNLYQIDSCLYNISTTSTNYESMLIKLQNLKYVKI